MPPSFWTTDAEEQLLGRVWPWTAPEDDAAFRRRVRKTLTRHWAESRLPRAPDRVLPAALRTRMNERRDHIGSDAAAGGGFEKVAAAVEGESEAFWFFDLGAPAWVVHLSRMRLNGWLPGEADPEAVLEVERAWREGPDRAVAELDTRLGADPDAQPALALYRVPLALWHEGDVERAMWLLDRASVRLPPRAVRALGATLPLTYALMSALSGDVERAAALLDPNRPEARPAGWRGFRHPETIYQRARYLWDLRRHDEAGALLIDAFKQDASLALRLYSDAGWRRGGESAPAASTYVGTAVEEARKDLARWQQSRPTGDVEDAPAAARIDEVLEGSDAPYYLLAARSLLPRVDTWRRQQFTVSSEFRENVEDLQAFARTLASDFPFRAGADYRAAFADGPDSDMAHLEELLREDRLDEAARLVDALHVDLPYAVKMATIAYVERMIQALISSAEVLDARQAEGDRNRVRAVFRLAQRVLGLREPIRDLPKSVGKELAFSHGKLWRSVRSIQQDWVTLFERAFGEPRLLTPDDPAPVTVGTWRALPVKIVDTEGSSVPGVPVLWRVRDGNARPRNPAEFLTLEWSLSLQTGLARLPVEGLQPGEAVLEARLLHDGRTYEVPFAVVPASKGG